MNSNNILKFKNYFFTLRSLSRYIDFTWSLAKSCFTGDIFKIAESIEAMTLWFLKASVSEIRSSKVPFSIAWRTTLCTELDGVIIFSFLRFKIILPLWQFLAQTPHPKHTS